MLERIEFPLVDSSYDNEEILACIATLLSGKLTMGTKVQQFERAFAEHIGAPYAVMVNSGSSANLLALSVLTNAARRRRLTPGDYVAVPAVCWSTSLWPIIQTNLTPVLVDVDPNTLNLSIPSLRVALERFPIKAVMMVHILGNSTDMSELLELVAKHDLILVEDTCESLGSRYRDSYLGSVGEFGTFSFYFSHHMTTIEGGMVIARTQEDNDLLRCLRSHGWSREQSARDQIEARHKHIDSRFLFINVGYNLRPMEIQAAFGLAQIRRLNEMNGHRRENTRRIRRAFQDHPLWKRQIRFPHPPADVDPCWFGFCFIVEPSVAFDHKRFTGTLLQCGIDTRPIVSGNMALQPAVQLFNVDCSLGPFTGAQLVHDRGLFIGCHTKPLDEQRIQRLVTTILETLTGGA
jgi:CDP-6-deoxy-D-xylo-4-hexulose-3-dehydrase